MIKLRYSNIKDTDDKTVDRICTLINDVYADSESGMWGEGFRRISEDALIDVLKKEQIIIAELDDMIAGVIKVMKVNDEIGEFGTLATDPVFRKKGIGGALVKEAEDWIRKNNLKYMQLEILIPREWKHPSKEFLKIWYKKLGYEPHSLKRFEDLNPDFSSKLGTICDFTVWRKRIV